MANVSDLHFGSHVAVCMPTVTLENGSTYRANDAQLWVWERWLEFWDEVSRYKRRGWHTVTVVNGEFKEGNHHETSQLVQATEDDMNAIAIEGMRPAMKATNALVVTTGTDAHSGPNGSGDRAIARELGAKIDPDTGQRAAGEWELDVGGVIFDIAHHINAGKYNIHNELTKMVLDANGRRLDVVLRGHVHRRNDAWLRGRYGAVTPSWKLKDSHGRRVTREKTIEVGGLLVEVDGGEFNPMWRVWEVPRRRPARISV